MAQYIIDFSRSVEAAQPTGWTHRWDTTYPFTVKKLTGALGGRTAQAVHAANARSLLSMDVIDGVADLELLGKARHSSASGYHFGLLARCSGAAGSETGYYAQVDGDTLYLGRYNAGVATSLANVTAGVVANTFYWIRFRLTGDLLHAKIWEDGTDEPTAWTLSHTDAAPILTGGWNGLAGYAEGTYDYDAFVAETTGVIADFDHNWCFPGIITPQEGLTFVHSVTTAPPVVEAMYDWWIPSCSLKPSGSAIAPTSVLPDFLAGMVEEEFLYDFYFRIWVIPSSLSLRNPKTGVPIPFAVWNAYPWDNTLTSIAGTDLTDLDFDVVPPKVFREVEYVTVNLTIQSDAPLKIDTDVIFTFTDGAGTLYVVVDRATVVNIIPDVPVIEKWKWLTDVMTATDGTEQRVALRSVPRRSQTARLIATTEEQVKANMKRLQFDSTGLIVVPYFAYATEITAPSAAGTSDLTFDPKYTDVRAGEYVFILTPTGEEELASLLTLGVSGATTDAPLTVDVPKGSIIAPAFASIITGKPSVDRFAVNYAAEIRFDSEVALTRSDFSRPNSLATITYYDGYPVLDQRPLVPNRTVNDTFDSGLQVFDYETGDRELVTHWDWARIYGERQFMIRRYEQPEVMDYWRDFLNIVKGLAKPFLVSTLRNDHQLAEDPVDSSRQILILGSDYASLYFHMESHKRLVLKTAAGDLFVTIDTAEVDANGNSLCTMTSPLPTGAEYTQISQISYLLKVRLDSDEVELEHHALDSFLNLRWRTVPE